LHTGIELHLLESLLGLELLRLDVLELEFSVIVLVSGAIPCIALGIPWLKRPRSFAAASGICSSSPGNLRAASCAFAWRSGPSRPAKAQELKAAQVKSASDI
jgi:hypothetical protein